MKDTKSRTIVELVGAIAVLMGLVFVGLELRQNTNAVQASTLQGMVDISSNYLADLARDPEATELIMRAREDPRELDALESQQARLLLRSQWLRYQGAFRHWQRGSLGTEDWGFYERFVCSPNNDAYAGLQAYYWPSERAVFQDDFVTYVEACRSDLGSSTL